MIRYLRHQQIDKKLWDQCIDEATDGIIYAYSWYLDLICEGWDALVEDEYTSVMPVTKGRKYLMDYVYPPFFAQQLGVFSKKPMSNMLSESFLNALPAAFRYVEMNLHRSNESIPEGFSKTPKTDLILSMGKDYSTIRKSYSENHLRNIKKAEKNNLSLFKFGNVNDVIGMFRQHRGRFLANLQNADYEVFRQLTLSAIKRNMARVWVVNDQYGVPCAAAVFFESHSTGIFVFSATTKKGKELSAMHFLIDNYIHEFCRELSMLDFEGSNDTDLARFYRGFGSTDYVYLQIKKNQLPRPWKWFKN